MESCYSEQVPEICGALSLGIVGVNLPSSRARDSARSLGTQNSAQEAVPQHRKTLRTNKINEKVEEQWRRVRISDLNKRKAKSVRKSSSFFTKRQMTGQRSHVIYV